MDGWTIGLAAGFVVIVLLCVLMTVVVKAAAGTAAKAKDVLAVLEAIQADAAAVSTLDGTALSREPKHEDQP